MGVEELEEVGAVGEGEEVGAVGSVEEGGVGEDVAEDPGKGRGQRLATIREWDESVCDNGYLAIMDVHPRFAIDLASKTFGLVLQPLPASDETPNSSRRNKTLT